MIMNSVAPTVATAMTASVVFERPLDVGGEDADDAGVQLVDRVEEREDGEQGEPADLEALPQRHRVVADAGQLVVGEHARFGRAACSASRRASSSRTACVSAAAVGVDVTAASSTRRR